MKKKAILLDVDGPLNPFNAKIVPEGYQQHRMYPTGFEYGNGLRVLLRHSDGPSMASYGAEIIWATMWEGDANEWIGPHLGLPKLPFIDWDETSKWDSRGLHFKTRRIASWMNEHRKGMDFLWIDDECGHHDREWLNDHIEGTASILRVSPKTGLTTRDWAFIGMWSED